MVDVAFWQERYDSGVLPWDLGDVAPPFKSLLQEKKDALLPGKMLVVGCGAGHDAIFFAEQGFEVIGIDVTQQAVALATESYGEKAVFKQENLFDLPESYAGEYDYVLEHTCFCAIDPKRRSDYVRSVADVLKADGKFVGLFWAHGEWGGPPYGTNKEEIINTFSADFHIDFLEPAVNSVEMRAGEELIGIFLKKT